MCNPDSISINVFAVPSDDYVDLQADNPPFQTGEEYHSEAVRLSTFQSMPSLVSVPATRLARAGFYYSAEGDEVVCFSCGWRLRRRACGHDPAVEHRNFFPECPLMNGTDTENVPLFPRDDPVFNFNICDNVDPFPNLANPTSTPRDHGGNVSSLPSSQQALSRSLGISVRYVPPSSRPIGVTTAETLGILTERPRHGIHAIEDVRVRTFANWLPSRIQRPEELARAGFFYVGFGDNVKCFFCNGGLRNWAPQDDLWAEHARWFPRCGFVRLCKGDEFIRMIRKQNSPNNPPPRAQAQAQAQRPQDTKNSRLKEELTCKICMVEEVGVVFLPCGHLVACVQCAPALRNCPICRVVIKGVVRSILS
ncbi:baculoviral IAP repeat-containing protein 7-B-like [Lingula anatina]|uniref:Baculoviral IAP repeat-containing protein 7-B-like n=1 Tax=Lingula anatina TaxID=7574 RepID=A0A2R2MKD5_LINAN|nr:baculoviral IAP repeat-containing protein 7-B-like [Lingula anatina]|eukprot:XP_023930660.1 baculoviral IAP repeat-containing protein 7-B-like [Lingula anatina]